MERVLGGGGREGREGTDYADVGILEKDGVICL